MGSQIKSVSNEQKEKPKRPKNSYLLFVATKDEMEEKYADLSTGERAKKLGTMWKQMSDTEKKPYQEKARKAMAIYKASQKKKSSKKTGPKSPKSSYMLFSSVKS